MFQRMVAIPQEEYMQLTSVQQINQPLTQQFYKLERQYADQERIRDPYQRMVMQSETLDDMKALKERMREDLKLATPKPYQSRALALYQSLHPFIKFNERGEIFDKDDELVPESRLEDLIQYAVRDRRRAVVPTGWTQFRTLLQTQNVPKFMLNRDTLQEMSKANIKQELTRPAKDEVKSEPLIRLDSSSSLSSKLSEQRQIRDITKKRTKRLHQKWKTAERRVNERARKPNAKYKSYDFLYNY